MIGETPRLEEGVLQPVTETETPREGGLVGSEQTAPKEPEAKKEVDPEVRKKEITDFYNARKEQMRAISHELFYVGNISGDISRSYGEDVANAFTRKEESIEAERKRDLADPNFDISQLSSPEIKEFGYQDKLKEIKDRYDARMKEISQENQKYFGWDGEAQKMDRIKADELAKSLIDQEADAKKTMEIELNEFISCFCAIS